MAKKKQKHVEIEIEDFCIKQFPPAAYVYSCGANGTYSVMQSFGRVSAAKTFAAVMRHFAPLKVVEVAELN